MPRDDGTTSSPDPTRSLSLILEPVAQVDAEIVDLRWACSEAFKYQTFATLEAAASCAGPDSLVEEVTLRNQDGALIHYGRLLASPTEALHIGAIVRRVWYTFRQGCGGPRAAVIQSDDDVEYEDFKRVPRPPGGLDTIVEHLRFQQGTRLVDTEARYLTTLTA